MKDSNFLAIISFLTALAIPILYYLGWTTLMGGMIVSSVFTGIACYEVTREEMKLG